MKKNRLVSTAIAGTLAAAIVVGGGTFAYLKSNTHKLTNTFTANNITVKLTENNLDATNQDKVNSSYTIIPGTTQYKDPKVSIETTVSAYVFVTVKDTVNTTDNTFVTYSINSNWKDLGITTGDGEKVYAREVNETTENMEVLDGNQVSYSKNLTSTGKGGDLVFKAYAIQKMDNENNYFANATAAWNALNEN